jgi:flavin reductase (DIM6/NTAB) family NADH-FMN oxidoreductase RutF
MIKKSREFAINLTSKELVRAADWCGVHTGAKVDKFERCCLQKEEANEISCPILADAPVALECRVTDVLPMGSHDVFMADILRVSCHETLLDEKGKIHMERAGLLAYAHGEYYTLGKRVGAFGFSAAKKKKHPQKKAAEGAKKPQKKEARDK